MAYCSSYYLYQRYEKRGDQDWIPSYPNVYSIDGEGSKPLRARQMYDTDCGWIPDTEPIYRWTEIAPTSDPNSYWCDNCSSLYANQPFTVVAHNEDVTITMVADTSEVFEDVQFSTDKGQTWSGAVNTDRIYWVIPANTSFSVKGMIKTYLYSFKISEASGGTFDVEGNIMSLVSNNWESITSPINFQSLFSGHTNLISAENLVLPATTLSNYCYANMFSGCTSLTAAPALPATTLAQGCYSQMFTNCTSLTSAPALPATTLANYCYSRMFNGCSSLTNVPNLPATTLANGCYQFMFDYCISLSSVPNNLLPATTLAEGCYAYMFNYCSNLTAAPELPATTLVAECYYNMFLGCSSLNYIKCLATDISARECTTYWVAGVAETGTFVKNSSMNDWPIGQRFQGIPSGWTIQNA